MRLNVLVAGGAGYIGSHMVLALRQAGHAVSVPDNLSRGHRGAVLRAPLVDGDLRRCSGSKPFDLVMHFAALAYVGGSMAAPAAYYANNVQGSLNLLKAMRDAGVGRIVFSSTCARYGNPRQLPMTEDHPQQPINLYGATNAPTHP